MSLANKTHQIARRGSLLTRFTFVVAIATTTTVPLGAVRANYGIVLETINDYSYTYGTHSFDLACNTQGAGLWNPLTAAGSPWVAKQWWQDSSVWDNDFYDRQLTGNPDDGDWTGFDSEPASQSPAIGTALSWFCGHGQCDDWTNTACTSDADCGANAYCPNFPLAAGQTAACITYSSRRLITSTAAASHGNAVLYGYNPTGTSPLSIALGEDINSGSWAGVGTDGGTNIAMISNSCGMRFRVRTQEQNHFFAGVHMVMMHMPVGNIKNTSGPISNMADTANWSGRGAYLANLIQTNYNAPASNAWTTPLFTNQNYFNGGAGADIVAAWDTTATAASNRIWNETWTQSLDDTRDATSAAGGWYRYICNFTNCSSYAL